MSDRFGDSTRDDPLILERKNPKICTLPNVTLD
jgi:hypothetical protein